MNNCTATIYNSFGITIYFHIVKIQTYSSELQAAHSDYYQGHDRSTKHLSDCLSHKYNFKKHPSNCKMIHFCFVSGKYILQRKSLSCSTPIMHYSKYYNGPICKGITMYSMLLCVCGGGDRWALYTPPSPPPFSFSLISRQKLQWIIHKIHTFICHATHTKVFNVDPLHSIRC